MAKDKRCVLLYCDLIFTVEKLSDINAGLLFKHYLRYINDLNPESPNELLDIVFEPIKQQLKRDLKEWEKTKEGYSRGGKVSAEKRSKLREVQPASTNSTVIVNVTDTVNDTVNDKVKVKDIFKNKLLSFGFDKILVEDWLKVRKEKRASNTETAFNGFVKQVELTGMDKNEVLKICVERSWSGLKAEWILKEKPNKDDKNFMQKRHETYLEAKKMLGL